MPKDHDRFKGFDVMLPQGARSRHQKAIKLMDEADHLVPDDALDGDAASIRQAIKHLHGAAENLSELMAYRKMIGVD